MVEVRGKLKAVGGYNWGKTSNWYVHFSFCDNQTIFYARYSKLSIPPWKFKDKVMVKTDVHILLIFLFLF